MQTPQKPHSHAPKDNHDEEVIVDTSKMSKGQQAALEMTESAREKEWQYPSFGSQMFMGKIDWSMLHPFPAQSAEDKTIGDRYIEELSTYLKEHLDPEEVDETRTIPQSVIDEMFRLGIFAMKVPKEYEGLGFSQVNYNRVMMNVASYCGATAVLISAHQSIGVPEPLKVFGTEKQKRQFFPRFRKNAISAFALTEVEVGSDPAQMKATAELTPDGKHYIINGQKLWCTNGPIANVMVVMAKTAPKIVNGKEKQQITAFIVECNTPGIEVLHRCDFMGIRGIQNGLLKFTNVKVPAENILWKEGRGLALALKTLNTGRLTLPAACTGMAKQCLSIARRWGKQRVQWGAPVALHEAGSQKIAYIASMTFAMEAITWLTSNWADKKEVDIRIEAAMAKLYCTEASWKIADMTLQLRGGRGYERSKSLKERGEEAFPVERIMRDARINTIIEGTSEIMRLFLAREALDSHLKLAEGFLSKRSSTVERAKSALQMLGFYSKWYPSQWINSSLWTSHPEMGSLSEYCCFVDRSAHRLARTLFHYMAKYKEKLERKQTILGHLIDIGTEIFAIAATCAYATAEMKKNPSNKTAEALAQHFCSHARHRINDHFKALKQGEEKKARDLAQQTLDGKLKWLEEGIIWMGNEEE